MENDKTGILLGLDAIYARNKLQIKSLICFVVLRIFSNFIV